MLVSDSCISERCYCISTQQTVCLTLSCKDTKSRMTAYALQCRDELCVTVRGDGCQTHIFGCQPLAQILLKVWKAYSVRTLFTEHLSFSKKKKKKENIEEKKSYWLSLERAPSGNSLNAFFRIVAVVVWTSGWCWWPEGSILVFV